MRLKMVALLLLSACALAQQRADSRPGPNAPIPRSTPSGESSSKDTKVDLTPPLGDAADHPDSGDVGGVYEMHKWNPLRAMKNIEVGDYYFSRKNYPAAESRYREALDYKPGDAKATFRLAQVLEKLDRKDEARKQYLAYLKILPNGPDASTAKAAIERLGK